MKKNISIILVALCLVFVVSSCGGKTYKSFTFSVDTGDKVKIKLDTTDGYNLTSDLPFTISQNGSVLTQGIFIEAEQFDSYVKAANTDANAKIIEISTKDSNQYVFWSYNDSEFNMVIRLNDSNTGILLGNIVSEDSAKECFERLTISLE